MTHDSRPALVAVHDSATRLAVRETLTRLGFAVRMATHFNRARDLVPGDLLVADLDWGSRTVFELLSHYERCGIVPMTILVADQLDDEDVRRALSAGVRGWIGTQVTPGELERAVADLPGPRRTALLETYQSSATTTSEAPFAVAAFATEHGIGPAARARIASVCAELLENVERHAYPDGGGPVRVRAWLESGDFMLEVSDEGIGFDPVLVTTGSMSRSLDGGLARSTALSENLRLSAEPGEGTTARATFTPASVQLDDGDGSDLSDLDFLPPHAARRVLATLDRGSSMDLFQLSPALAVVVGRLLVGPDPRRTLQMAMWS